MNPPNNAAVPFLSAVSCALSDVLARVRAGLQRADAWLQARQRFARDRGELARLSDRDLLDIGIDPTAFRPVRERDWLSDHLP